MPEFLKKLCVDGLRYRVPVPAARAGLNRVGHEWKSEQHTGRFNACRGFAAEKWASFHLSLRLSMHPPCHPPSALCMPTGTTRYHESFPLCCLTPQVQSRASCLRPHAQHRPPQRTHPQYRRERAYLPGPRRRHGHWQRQQRAARLGSCRRRSVLHRPRRPCRVLPHGGPAARTRTGLAKWGWLDLGSGSQGAFLHPPQVRFSVWSICVLRHRVVHN